MRKSLRSYGLKLLCVFVFACFLAEAQQAVEVRPVFLGKPLNLSPTIYAIKGDTVSIDRFRFYLSGIELIYSDGSRYVEKDSYHLVDVEDPSSCKMNFPGAKTGEITSMRFNVGVDSAASVSGALSGALDPVKGMYWAWNSGYINAKLEGTCKSKTSKKPYPFEFHIGGYMQPYYAIRSVELNVPKENPKVLILEADVAVWLEGVNLHQENSVVIPGAEAMLVADRYSKMFSTGKK